MIRRADLSEIRFCADLIREAGAETEIEPSVRWDAWQSMEEHGSLACWLVDLGFGQFVGYAVAFTGADMLGGKMALSTVSIYVQPQHRSRWGSALLQALRDEAKVIGATLRVACVPGSHLDLIMAAGGKRKPAAVVYEV